MFALALAALGLTATAATVQSPAAVPADTLEIEEWQVPWERTRPRDPSVAADGKIWFVGQVGNYIGIFDPATETFEKIDFTDRVLPHNITTGPDGAMWYAGNAIGHIGRVDPRTKEIRIYEMPDEAARDPHTLIFSEQGTLWFTVQGGNFIGRLEPSTGEVRLVPMTVGGARPYGIVVDENNRPWAALLGTNRIASVNPETMELEEHILPFEEARPRRLVRTDDGMIWYGDVRRGTLGRLDPTSGDVKEYPLPGGAEAGAYAMALDNRGRVWISETGLQPNRLVGFDPSTERFVSVNEVPSGGGAVRHMVYHEGTNSIWFGTDTNMLGRATVR